MDLDDWDTVEEDEDPPSWSDFYPDHEAEENLWG
jgi:hypothetical protein